MIIYSSVDKSNNKQRVASILERIEFVAGAQGEISDIVVVSAW